MLRKMKKCLSLLLVFCMIFSMTSIGAYADEIDAGDAPKTGSISTAATSKNEDESVSESSQESIEVINEGEPESDTTVDDAPSAETEAEEDENEEIDVEATRSARSTSSDDFYKIVHVDAGRKYFSPENIKKIIDNAAEAGFNQVELYLSDNQGFRFALDDMKVTTSTGNTYDLTPALGDGYSDGSKYPDYSGKYLTQSEMTEIIAYAGEKGIEIVPCINVPGHMGAILEEFTNFRYSGSNSSIDLENTEAVAFALAITEKYAEYFASQGVKFYNIGADEYANDLSTMGFQGLYTSGKYQNFVDFINNAAQIVINCGMTPRAFNDGICYNN
ncbi:MAG: family 20 glycosylhydrolase, partial [Clostridiales bacterium]|nr:family 20 glycosylhydrolase [Clostridiales bacterium]